ncbi:MAG: hypothetical protein WC437_01250 [Patescibacteria group bacterium]|jgi:hypothetical protein|nr:hypothetical protein [Patescibacteria group bacterium]
MKVINQKNDNLWDEVERSIEEHSPSGYKISCIEAEKVFIYVLKSKGYPTKDINQTLALFSWRLTDKEGLKKALRKTEQIKTTFDYQMTSFEAEDIVESFKQAIKDFSEAKSLSWQRKMVFLWQNYLSLKTSFAKRTIIGFLGFFLIIKLLSSTKVGQSIVVFFVRISNVIYSWFVLLGLVSISLLIMVIVIFAYLERKKTRIKSIDEKRT